MKNFWLFNLFVFNSIFSFAQGQFCSAGHTIYVRPIQHLMGEHAIDFSYALNGHISLEAGAGYRYVPASIYHHLFVMPLTNDFDPSPKIGWGYRGPVIRFGASYRINPDSSSFNRKYPAIFRLELFYKSLEHEKDVYDMTTYENYSSNYDRWFAIYSGVRESYGGTVSIGISKVKCSRTTFLEPFLGGGVRYARGTVTFYEDPDLYTWPDYPYYQDGYPDIDQAESFEQIHENYFSSKLLIVIGCRMGFRLKK